ncbi:MAG: hypothetical protein WC205_17785 [Opitutaceae bacterium]|jgi:hypothetical protein
MSSAKNRPALIIAVIALLIAATVVLCLVKLPWSIRLPVAGTDLIAAAIIFAVTRQRRPS